MTRMGEINFAILQVRGGGCYPSALEKGVNAEPKLHVFCRHEYAEISGLLLVSCSSDKPSLRRLLRTEGTLP